MTRASFKTKVMKKRGTPIRVILHLVIKEQ